MLYAEWNMEDALAYARKESWEDGRTKGHSEGHTEGRAEERQQVLELLNQGLSVDEIKERLKN